MPKNVKCQEYVSWKEETKGLLGTLECIFFDDIDTICQAPKAEQFNKSCPWFNPEWMEFWRGESA